MTGIRHKETMGVRYAPRYDESCEKKTRITVNMSKDKGCDVCVIT